jgi:hypothetical protein
LKTVMGQLIVGSNPTPSATCTLGCYNQSVFYPQLERYPRG